MSLFYVGVLVCLVLFIIGLLLFKTAISIKRKVTILVLLCLAGISNYRAVQQMYGHPILIQENLDNVEVIAFHAVEEEKVIHLWLIKDGETAPTSYIIAYSSKLHKELIKGRDGSETGTFMANIKVRLYPGERYDQNQTEVTFDIEATNSRRLPPKGN